MKNKIIAIALIGAMTLLTACGGNKDAKKLSGDAAYPETMTVFASRGPSLFGDMKDYNDVYAFQLLEEETGTHIEWILPPSSGYNEKFNLLITSGDLPDVIISSWLKKNVLGYIEDDVIFDMSGYVEEYAPNLTAFGKENPEVARQYVFDGGKTYFFPYVRSEQKLNVFSGPLIRTDWLDKLGLEIPETADELYEVLKAFKTHDPNGNGKADEIPMSGTGSNSEMGIGNLLGMFGTSREFYVDNGQVKYGVLEPEFEEGIKYIANLYAEGLIDIDFLLQDRGALIGKITNDRVGFAYEYQPTQIMAAMAETNPTFKFEGIPQLKDKNGNRRTTYNGVINSYVDSSAAITTSCENPLGVMKWFDNLYSEEGIAITNFGKEGNTYNIVDGTVKFTDAIENNPDGLTRSQVWGKNFSTYNSYFPGVQKWESYGFYLSEYGRTSIETWSDVNTDKLLPTLTFGTEDQEVITSKYTQIKTYVDEYIDKIILGRESIDKLPEIREKIRKIGIDDVLKIYQKEYDNYMNKDIGF